MNELKSCGVLVVRGEPVREFLLMRHADRWDLPKGHVDPGESEIQCALRELAEETGIQATDIELDPAFRFQLHYQVCEPHTGGQWRLKSLIIFLAQLRHDVEIVLTEHLGYEWFRWEPPHHVQQQTIDPLLHALGEHLLARSRSSPKTDVPRGEHRNEN
ncbi:MAG: NUDIX domain-containing protein [Planctomycetaceae bacterium]|nr:NUDIX domain-containing protein [Planctomycetaceae bacterium]MBX3452836.1 NUDIX domain-containing protein [Planctomycetaceae bacterium]